MTLLELPHQLQGPWDHALIVTYGLDIPFFERTLWRQFSARCRNKIILADGQRFLEACSAYAEGYRGRANPQVRMLNQRYVAEGIFAPRDAHAKVILLTNHEQGRLLVGSGNLNWQGYASGGELFTCYDYSKQQPETLNAFVTVRQWLEAIIVRGYISHTAQKRIQHLLEGTPWMYAAPTAAPSPVRHNLEHSFIEQLHDMTGDQVVEELWALAPFHDQRAVALDTLLDTLNPQRAAVLIQPRATSADPDALRAVLGRYGARCELRTFTATNGAYVHAKLYVLKLADRAICLHGSPNLSQVALLWSGAQANLEIANLLVDQRDAFDDLFAALDHRRIADDGHLDIRYQSIKPADHSLPSWHLTSGEWRDTRLRLDYRGNRPHWDQADLCIGETTFPILDAHITGTTIEMNVAPEAADLLQKPLPISVSYLVADSRSASNAIFVCNITALQTELETSGETERLAHIGGLDVGDAEVEQLLNDLNAALAIDGRSIWQIAGRQMPTTSDEQDDALRLDYADIDYEQLRQHPKIQQYLQGRLGGQRLLRSRLQIILSAITDHFDGLLEHVLYGQAVGGLGDDFDLADEDEDEPGEAQHPLRPSAPSQRLRRILKHFIRRYLRGLRSPDFQDVAGFEVMGQNYAIFSHLLWALYRKDWVELDFLIDSALTMWLLFWGDAETSGYIEQRSPEERAQILQWLRAYHADAYLLATLYTAWGCSAAAGWEQRTLHLRNFWCRFVIGRQVVIGADALEDTWVLLAYYAPTAAPPPSRIVEELTRLAKFDTRNSFLRGIERRFGLEQGCCRFVHATVFREALDRKDNIECLVLQDGRALATLEDGLAILHAWMQWVERPYYRIVSPDISSSRRLLIYDLEARSGAYLNKDESSTTKDLEEKDLARGDIDLDQALTDLMIVAHEIDQHITMPNISVTDATIHQVRT